MDRLTMTDNVESDLVKLLSIERKVTDREKDIIINRIIPFKYNKTLQELGTKWGVTRERIRQIQEKLLERLDVLV